MTRRLTVSEYFVQEEKKASKE